jgi:hypothetical protein
LNFPGFAEAQQSVVSKSVGRESGMKKVLRSIPTDAAKGQYLKGMSGVFTAEITDQLLQRPALLTVNWKLVRK